MADAQSVLLGDAGRPARGRSRRPGRPRRTGRTGRWLGAARAALVLALLAALGWWLNGLREGVRAAGFERIATDRARVDFGPGWVDPRWSDEVRALLAEVDDVQAADRPAVERLCARVRELSFVSSIGQAEVLWPNGLRLELTFREPIACLHAERVFFGVAADGTVLSGAWPTPPTRDSGFLPVIELASASERASRSRTPGARLSDPVALDGLAVAASLWAHLQPNDLARLGRIVIDARRARLASVEDPGCVLRLEGRRTVCFGRTPNLDAPGELPVAAKWEHVRRALALLEPDAGRALAAGGPAGIDWDLLDVRWDVPDLHPRADEANAGGAQGSDGAAREADPGDGREGRR